MIDRQIENNGLKPENVIFTDDGIKYLISHHTREAGLRNLEREVGSVVRKVAKDFVTGIHNGDDQVTINAEKVADLLGAPKFIRDEKLKENQVGVVTGLAWTQAGGEILYIEALKMKGTGKMNLTGKLGDVMKESASAALSYARAHSEELGIEDHWLDVNDIHIHIPAGAIPKDGPSAGVTMATALTSLMTGTPVRKDIAMTGEVTLTGRVLPVGGIREKCLAALNHGITTVILPFANQKDLSDIPDEFKNKMKFIFVENLDEVFALALDKSWSKRTKTITTSGSEGRSTKDPAAAAAS